MAMNTSNKRSLHEWVVRENVTAREKVYCRQCGEFISDNEHTRSAYCAKHRKSKKCAKGLVQRKYPNSNCREKQREGSCLMPICQIYIGDDMVSRDVHYTAIDAWVDCAKMLDMLDDHGDENIR